MKLFLLTLMIALGLCPSPEPPTVNTEGLCVVEVVEPVSNKSDLEYIAKTIYGEARGLSTAERAQVAWCILNRVDDENFPDTVESVCTQPNQFYGYSASFPATEDNLKIAEDVYKKWQAEKNGESVKRELEKGYLYFCGDGQHNYFW